MTDTNNDAMIIPMYACADLERTLAHYRALGFEVTYEQYEPYAYGATQWGGIELHFHQKKAVDPEHGSACLVMIDDVADVFASLAAGLRRAHRGLPVTGFPRITRFREGHTRFTVYDPDGNALMFVANDEPDYDYDSNATDDDSAFGRTLSGIGRTQSSLMQALETAVFLRDTYHNDSAAARKLDNALAALESPVAIEHARALAARAELAVALGEAERASALILELEAIPLGDEERAAHRDELESALQLQRLLLPPDDE